MDTTSTTIPDQRLGELATTGARSEWNARGLRPVAHWVQMPSSGGHTRLAMVWEVPDPMPPSLRA